MKKAFRILAFALMCLMLVPMIVACNTNTPVATGGGAIIGDPENQEVLPELLPEGTRFDGYEFHVIVGGNFKQNDFAYVEGTEDQVDQARYKRNAAEVCYRRHGRGYSHPGPTASRVCEPRCSAHLPRDPLLLPRPHPPGRDVPVRDPGSVSLR